MSAEIIFFIKSGASFFEGKKSHNLLQKQCSHLIVGNVLFYISGHEYATVSNICIYISMLVHQTLQTCTLKHICNKNIIHDLMDLSILPKK